MALQKDVVSIILSKGVNSKSDSKIAQPDQSNVINDGRFDKDFRVVKRNGLVQQGTAVQGDPGFINPVTMGTLFHSKVFAHEDQLCQVNNGNLFSQFDQQNKWVFKGTCLPIDVNSKRVDANVNFRDAATVNGITVACGSQTICVIEETTGNILTKTVLSGSETTLKVGAFSTAAYVFTYTATAVTTATLFARPINLTNGSVGAAVTVTNDFTFTNSFLGTAATYFATTKTSTASTIGEAIFIAYAGTVSNILVIPFAPSGTVPSLGLGTMTSLSVGVPFNVYIEPVSNPNRLYASVIAQSTAAGNYVAKIASATFSSSAYSMLYSTSATVASMAYTNFNTGAFSGSFSSNNLTMALSPVNNSDLYIFIDELGLPSSGTISVTYSDDAAVAMLTVSSGGTVTSNSIYGRGYLVGANAIRDTVRKTIYLPVVYSSPLQSALYLVDIFEGNSGTLSYFIGKNLYQAAAAPSAGFLCSSDQVGTSSVYRITNNGYFVDYNFTPTYAQNSQYFAKTTHLTGGLLWAYDGETLSEHNFLAYPERLSISTYNSGQAVGVSIIQQGDASNREITDVSFASGGAFSSSTASTPGFQITTISGGVRTTRSVYLVSGGTSGASGTNVFVGLLSTDTAQDVAYKVQSVGVPNLSGSLSSSATVRFTTSENGTVADASTFGTASSGTLGAGAWSYVACYKYTDRNGQVYRSATSVPQSAGVSLGTSASSIVVFCPPITNKPAGTVLVELYRNAVANGSTYQLLQSSSIGMSGSISRLNFQDTGSSNASNAFIYINGGVLDNSNIGACSAVSYFKERLVVNTTDNLVQTFYSKSLTVGEPVNFAQELFFQVDADQSSIRGYAPMDDKLIVFKRPYIYVMSGDGANDLGQNSTLTPPMLIASDVGTNNPNSIILYPNGLLFKSDKGIYQLSRGLGVSYLGAPVEDYNSYTVSGAVLMRDFTEIRFTLSDTTTALVYNYFFNRWDYFTNYKADSVCLWQGTLATVQGAGIVSIEGSNFYDLDLSGGTSSYSLFIEFPWLRLKDIQSFQRIYELMVLGEYLSPHTMTMRIQYDYDTTQTGTYTFNATQVIGSTLDPYQFVVRLNRQKCDAIKFSLTENPGTGSQQSVILNDLSAVVGLKRGLNKLRPGKQL